MSAWVWPALAYAGYLTIIAFVRPVSRRPTAIAASILFGLAAAGASMVDDIGAQVILPGALTLGGYWLSGLFVGPPQFWLEQWLLESDRALFDRLNVDRLLAAVPRWILEFLEFAYSTVYLVVMAGAVLMASVSRTALISYWAVVLSAELACYAALPFLCSRPPRSLESPGAIAQRSPVMRRLNDRIVHSGSIQVNTIPSGHVAGALAAGLAVASWSPAAGVAFVAWAMVIALSATLGRYHYAIDCVLGAVVAVVTWLLVPGVGPR